MFRESALIVSRLAVSPHLGPLLILVIEGLPHCDEVGKTPWQAKPVVAATGVGLELPHTAENFNTFHARPHNVADLDCGGFRDELPFTIQDTQQGGHPNPT